MASWMNNLRNFGRGQNPVRNQNQAPARGNSSSPSTAYSPTSLGTPTMAAAPASPSFSQSVNTMPPSQGEHASNDGNGSNSNANGTGNPTAPTNRKPPFFFREKYANFIVRGNFLTLSAKPANVEEGEWLAHLVVEQAKVLQNLLSSLQTPDRNTGVCVCNERSCPTMTAGNASYTWVDVNRQPMSIPAPTYISNILRWLFGKINDRTLFPTDSFTAAPIIPTSDEIGANPTYWVGKSSGFPERFQGEVRNMYKQMMRIYGHLYHSHWWFFWDYDLQKELNTCFVHFINVGRVFDIIGDKDTEPMQPLIDIWASQGVLPRIEQGDAGKEEQSSPYGAGGGAAASNSNGAGNAVAST